MEATHGPPLVEQPLPRPGWLALHTEQALEPGLPIVDPHHHFSAHWGGYFGEALAGDLASGHRVVATVYVQCGLGYRTDGPPALAPVGEVERVLQIADAAAPLAPATRLCAAIVGFADLQLAEQVDAVLEAELAAARGRLRGIRRSASRHPAFRYGVLEPPPFGLYADARLRRGLARLRQYGLSFDALCFHHQLPELLDLARAFPDQPIVLNHLGAPLGVGPYRGLGAEVLAAWRASMRALAACSNVQVKLGGMGMATFGSDFAARDRPPDSHALAEAWRPYVESCIELFGADRCMFSSNFPVDKSQCSYAVLWNAFKRLAAGASADEKRALFHDTAVRCYRL